MTDEELKAIKGRAMEEIRWAQIEHGRVPEHLRDLARLVKEVERLRAAESGSR